MMLIEPKKRKMEQKGGQVGSQGPENTPSPFSLSNSLALTFSLPLTNNQWSASGVTTVRHASRREETTGPPQCASTTAATTTHRHPLIPTKNHASNPRKPPPTCRNSATHNPHDLFYKLGVKFWPKST